MKTSHQFSTLHAMSQYVQYVGRVLAMVLVLAGAQTISAQQQFQGVCSRVKVVIEQELTLERIGFEATLEVTNNDGEDPITDFAAIASVGSVPFALVIHPSLPATSVKEFIAFAQAKPGQLNYASAGTGGIGHLASALFAQRTGIQVAHVAYKGTGPAVAAVLSGEVQFMMPNLVGAAALVRAGKLKALGVASARRAALAPDLPTMAEAGVPGFEAGTWYGVQAPNGTPQAIVTLLNREINAALKMQALRDKLAALGIEADTGTPQQLAAFIRAEIEKWGGAMKDAGLSQESY